MAELNNQNPAMAEPSIVIDGATYYTRVIVPVHLAGVGLAGEFQHSKERERRFARMNRNHDSEAPKEYALREPNEGRTIRLVRDTGILEAFGDRQTAADATDSNDKDIKSVFNLIYFRSRQVNAAAMDALLKNYRPLTYQRKIKMKAIQNMQSNAQSQVITTYILKLAEGLRDKYTNLEDNARDPATVEPAERKRMIRALWDHGDGKKVVSFRMWYSVAQCIDFDAIFDPPEGIEQGISDAMKGWRKYLWNCFYQAMDKALTLRLLARDPGVQGKTVKQADNKYFAFWRNLTSAPGWPAQPVLGMIPITPEFGLEDGGDDEENLGEVMAEED